jgi:glyceraldehyde 3-phosphate dehydrogenase (phosphorylating)
VAITVSSTRFGRIGRQADKALRAYDDDKIDDVAVNDLGDITLMTHLRRYDTSYGRSPEDVALTTDGVIANIQ